MLAAGHLRPPQPPPRRHLNGAVVGNAGFGSFFTERGDAPRHHCGKNARRHEVGFGDAPVRVEIYSTEETVEILIETDFETLPEGRRRFASSTFLVTSLAKPLALQRDVP